MTKKNSAENKTNEDINISKIKSRIEQLLKHEKKIVNIISNQDDKVEFIMRTLVKIHDCGTPDATADHKTFVSIEFPYNIMCTWRSRCPHTRLLAILHIF